MNFVEVRNAVNILTTHINYISIINEFEPTEKENFIKRFEKENKLLTKQKEKEIVKKLLLFDINLLWDRNFYGLNSHESICAIAEPTYTLLRNIKEQYKNFID